MNILKAFVFSGIVCFLAQLILDNTKMTPGHVTSLFTVLGAFLGLVGLYDKFFEFAGGGASVLISNFGYQLYDSAMIGYQEMGILGLFSNLLAKGSCAIVGVVVFSFVLMLIFKPKD